MIPLSFAQQRLWFLDQLDGPSPAYNIPIALRLEGKLDVTVLRTALADVVARHEVLRTVFRAADGEPYQEVLEAGTSHVELDVVPALACELTEQIAAVVGQPFDLSADLPVRARLLALRPDELANTVHVLVVVIHHIAGDDWSMGLLARDISLAYVARQAGTEPSWPELPVQYADYALWQRDLLGSEDDPDSMLSEQVEYWRHTLAGIPEELVLPADRPRPPEASGRGHAGPLAVPADVHQQIADVARAHGVTVFMVLQAALAVLLARLGAGTDIPIGAPFAGRTDEALDNVVGCFVNTLVLRTEVSGNPAFAELLDQVREAGLDALEHQDIPFERLVELLAPARSLARHPLCQVMLTLQNNTPAMLALPGMRITMLPAGEPGIRLDLDVDVSESFDADGRPAGLNGSVNASADLFDQPTAERLAGWFGQVLAAVAADPGLRVGQVPVLSGRDRELVLSKWNDTARPVGEATVPELFAAQVAATPDAVAVISGGAVSSGGAVLSYRELDRASSRLARLLVGAGAGPERVAAVLLGRGAELIVTLLAVLKAGAAYLPVDPSYPAGRVRAMLADAAPACVVTSAGLAELAGGGCWPLVVLDDPATTTMLDGLADGEVTDADRAGPLLPSHPAYVIYTSGSTGVPKGVTVTHGNFSNLIVSHGRFEAGPGSVVAQFASPGFDNFGSEWSLALMTGAALAVVPDERRLGDDLAGFFAEHGVTHATLPPAVLATMDERSVRADVVLEVGGEACPPDVMARWSVLANPGLADPGSADAGSADAGAGGRVLFNTYGPTETTVDATSWRCEPGSATVPIGGPIANTRVFVLDEWLSPVPPGVTGELYVAGAGLARGYRGRSALTSERFVACPYAPPGARMYRTGDLARWSRDGVLEFGGRVDDQVQVRGFRIEPGEIEAVLAGHPLVGQAVVAARQDAPGEVRLAAYVVPAAAAAAAAETADQAVLAAELRGFVAARLPEYMVPAAVVVLAQLPLTPNGKVDRRALPAPDYRSARSGGAGQATEVEELICGAFAEILGVDRVGPDDSFFDLGGHSLLAIRLTSRVRAVLGVELPVRLVFEAPTPAGIARRLSLAGSGRTALSVRPRPERVPLSFAQRRLWFLGQLEGPSATYNIPVALRLTGDLDGPALRAALGDVAGRHEVLRTVFPVADGEPFQQVLDVAETGFDLEVTPVAEADLPARVAEIATQVFDLAVEVPVRARLLVVGPPGRTELASTGSAVCGRQSADRTELASTVHVLVVVLHHIAGDGWSLGLLARDVSAAYAARRAGRVPAWGALPVQYADYALWQRELLGSEDDPDSVVSRQVRYWRQALAGIPGELALPADRPRPARATHQGHAVPVHIPAQVHARLAAVARSHGATLFMVLQAALAVLLTRLGAGTDLPIGSPVAGRTDEALDDLVGFFINTLVLRIDTTGDPAFTDLITRVREVSLGALEHQDIPLERLVELLAPARSLARHPLFQVNLALQNNNLPELHLPGLHTTLLPAGHHPARFDLHLTAAETFGADGQQTGLDLGLNASADLFDLATAERIAGWFGQVLAAVAADPGLRVHQFPLLSAAEQQQVTSGWNQTAVAVRPATLPGLLAAQAAATPEAIAVVAGDTVLTYRQLDHASNRLARLLAGTGAGPERVVGVLLDRRAELVVALLGALKAGAAYLPIDPSYPAERVRAMLADARPACMVTSAGLAELAGGAQWPLVVVDDVATAAALDGLADSEITDADRAGPLLPSHPAYVIYTSGSTGTPKGVVVPHQAMVNYLAHCATAYPTLSGTTLWHASVSFDGGLTAVFGALAAGGCLHVAALDENWTAPRLGRAPQPSRSATASSRSPRATCRCSSSSGSSPCRPASS